MLVELSANKSGFKTVRFKTGLNIITADVTSGSIGTDTRNGAGKSTLIKLIQHCLGSNVFERDKRAGEALADWEFSLVLLVSGSEVSCRRSIANLGRVVVQGCDPAQFDNPVEVAGGLEVGNDEWVRFLGRHFFGLHFENNAPSARSLLSYIARMGSDAYDDPFRYFRTQNKIQISFDNAFIVGLAYDAVAELRDAAKQISNVGKLEQGLKSGVIESASIQSQGKLKSLKVALEREYMERKERLDSFRVLPDYEEVERNADFQAKRLHEISDEIVSLTRQIDSYLRQPGLDDLGEAEVSIGAFLEELESAVGSALKKEVSEVAIFHRAVIANRREFLEAEIDSLRGRLKALREEQLHLANEKEKNLQLLKTHGALDEYSLLRSQLEDVSVQLREVNKAIELTNEIRETRRRYKEQKEKAIDVIEASLDERRQLLDLVIDQFYAFIKRLYGFSGRLVVDVNEKYGYDFSYDVERHGSEGITKMSILCYDFAVHIARNAIADFKWPHFIVHDSMIFNGVDSRQRAAALLVAKEQTERLGTQYVCTINSDHLPRSYEGAEIDWSSDIVLTLSDKGEEGQLLGFRF